MIVLNRDDRGVAVESMQVPNGTAINITSDGNGVPKVLIGKSSSMLVKHTLVIMTDTGVIIEEHKRESLIEKQFVRFSKDFYFATSICLTPEGRILGGHRTKQVAIYTGSTLAEGYEKPLKDLLDNIVLTTKQDGPWRAVNKFNNASILDLSDEIKSTHTFWGWSEEPGHFSTGDYTSNYVGLNMIKHSEETWAFWQANLNTNPEAIIDAIKQDIVESTRQAHVKAILLETGRS
jgi:hypothetical protein